jgi:CRISPR/Cas system CSM-associated protein Csm3 (group 7 of RAMP superfamily)
MAEALGEIGQGEKAVSNIKTRNRTGNLEPSFLASSVKGVFRSAAAWLVERTARQQYQNFAFITCDYWKAVPKQKQSRITLPECKGLCPVCRVFGGSGCLSGEEGNPIQRQQSLVRFGFGGADDTARGAINEEASYSFAWQQIKGRGAELTVEQLQFASNTALEAWIEPASEIALALLWLAGDLVSSGFFRFGRFTSRGYGVVRLQPEAYNRQSLYALLSGEDPTPQLVDGEQSGKEVAQTMLGRDPHQIVATAVIDWLGTQRR